MNTFLFAVSLTIISNVFYHLVQKSIPSGANPFASIIVTYIIALAASILLYPFFPANGNFIDSVKSLNWTSIALGITIIGVELGYLLTYRSGGNLNYIPILITTAVMILLIPVGIFAFKEKFTLYKALGIILGIGSIVLLNFK